jgi:regulator of PEP synthase PpsR (kinase-PPPase family)
MKRYVFMVSDGTGITAESLGNGLLSQFEHVELDKQSMPYIDSIEKANDIVYRINQCYEETKLKPLVFMTLMDSKVSARIKESNASVFDLFSAFLGPLEDELQMKSSYRVGRTHGVANIETYTHRIDAVNYTLAHDDGILIGGYANAEIILVGVSRSGKTPSCLYMALQFGILAANYPFTDDELYNFRLPEALRPYKKKLFGLTIDPQRLHEIRSERRRNSQYAHIDQCRREVNEVEAMYRYENIPYLNSTRFSIEEIVTKIMAAAELKRKI